jgi:hypothetical protein
MVGTSGEPTVDVVELVVDEVVELVVLLEVVLLDELLELLELEVVGWPANVIAVCT